MTSRVMVNRVWHWLFGEGIVPTPDNFGTTGHLPSNQALLDTLAVEFRDGGWSVKKLVREIVLSHAYQLASTYDAKSFAADPENTLHWRMNKRRLDAECIRDAVLAASGQLEKTAPAGSAIALAGDGPIGGRALRHPGGDHRRRRRADRTCARSICRSRATSCPTRSRSSISPSRASSRAIARRRTCRRKRSSCSTRRSSARRPRRSPSACSAAVPNEVNFEQRVQLGVSPASSAARRRSRRKPPPRSFSTASPSSPARATGRAGDFDQRAGVTWATYCRALFASAEFRYVD